MTDKCKCGTALPQVKDNETPFQFCSVECCLRQKLAESQKAQRLRHGRTAMRYWLRRVARKPTKRQKLAEL